MTGDMFYDYTVFGYKRALPVIRKKRKRKESFPNEGARQARFAP
jgi:hypothetical protein